MAIFSALPLVLPIRAEEEFITAPNPDAPLVSQLLISGNACGPAALLNAFRLGSPDWRQTVASLPGDTERERLGYLIRRYGVRPSSELAGRNRWRHGVNLGDLCDMANEMIRPQLLPQLCAEVFPLNPGDDHITTLTRLHHCIGQSLRRGLPPVACLRLMTYREPTQGGAPAWIALRSHFVTITRVPASLVKKTDSFAVSYIDPWGTRYAEGVIRLPVGKHPSFCFDAAFPTMTQARQDPSGDKSPASVTFAGLLGRF